MMCHFDELYIRCSDSQGYFLGPFCLFYNIMILKVFKKSSILYYISHNSVTV